MDITCSKNTNGNITIMPGERFTFDVHREFRNAYRDQAVNINYTINLSKTTYMDSSALGMLLILREFNGENKRIKIIECRKEIYKVFEIARFDKIFQIDQV